MPEISVNQDRLVELFIELARHNTPPKHETAAMHVAANILNQLGFEINYDTAGETLGGDIGNLIAFKKGALREAPCIFFSSHFDTVEPTPGLDPQITGDRIHSDGTTILGADNKAGLAAIIEAMRILDEENIPHGDIQLLLTICEEICLLGAKHLNPMLIKAKYGFVLDTTPPIGSTIIEAPFQDVLDIKISGIPAHAGVEPENGVSAIQIAALGISRMQLGRIDTETTANIGIINGGSATNIVTPEVTIRAEARSLNRSKLEAQTASMAIELQRAATELGGKVEVRVERMYNGYRHDVDSKLIQIVEQATIAIGLEHKIRTTGGGADANRFNEFGVPTAVIACAMCNIHTHEEYASITDMVNSTKQVVSIIKVVAGMKVS